MPQLTETQREREDNQRAIHVEFGFDLIWPLSWLDCEVIGKFAMIHRGNGDVILSHEFSRGDVTWRVRGTVKFIPVVSADNIPAVDPIDMMCWLATPCVEGVPSGKPAYFDKQWVACRYLVPKELIVEVGMAEIAKIRERINKRIEVKNKEKNKRQLQTINKGRGMVRS